MKRSDFTAHLQLRAPTIAAAIWLSAALSVHAQSAPVAMIDASHSTAAVHIAVVPGSAVDKQLLGTWALLDDKGAVTNAMTFSTDPADYAKVIKLLQSNPLFAKATPQANEIAVIAADGKPLCIMQALDLANGEKLLLPLGNSVDSVAMRFSPDNGGQLKFIGLGLDGAYAAKHPGPEELAQVTRLQKDKLVMANLKEIAFAAQAYMLAQNMHQATYQNLLGKGGDSFIKPLTSAYGEKYDTVVVKEADDKVSISLPDGRTLTFDM
ncbi:MAG TPA: hypothetical protein VK737_06230 [Opitutales bacterium]|jgi:hypothetical protein|nr:hypothetical protein [Opitutales bacterium]